MRLIRWRDLEPVAWKNGGGSTHEIWREPASGMDFDWRVSVAEVAAPGSFSLFPGYDRIIMPLSLNGMRLMRDGQLYQELSPLVAFQFPGELQLAAELPKGEVEDLNLIVRRGAGSAALTLQRVAVGESVQPPEGTRLVFVVSGAFRIGAHELGARDSLLFSGSPTSAITGNGTLACCVVN